MPAWRLIVDEEPGPGAWNMAVDRALVRARAGGAPPTLRIYGWAAPTASLGRFQPLTGVDASACERYGVEVVRRPTGGRGVLHDDEVTYSVVAGLADGVPRGVAPSYAHFGAGLVRAYALLGLRAEVVGAHAERRGSAACYLATTQADLALAGAKLSGSAQVWDGGICLQHGSFVLTRDVVREAAVFGIGEEGERELARRTVTLSDALGARPARSAVAAAIRDGFAGALGVEVEARALTSAERDEAAELARTFEIDLPGGPLKT